MKTFTVAGTSVEAGTTKFRVANDLKGRIAMLERCENTDIQLFELPAPLTRVEAAQYLLDNNLFPDAPAVVVAAASTAPKAAPAASKPKKAKVAATPPAQSKPVSDDTIARLVEEKRILFPSFTDQQLLEVVTFQAGANMKEFGDVEPNF